ncbi:putative ribonuclease H-like domain-containing protein [Lupinus albus]|uniref:Putative ribonuclease H-like domain-containing protein n=1 Tax=Lupinus albus TaxID=3870 RepID=A0A6A4NPL6_LUPAL|nr:putative ribonuclease H-like domain-containing protein [Lupinus albus]
MFETTEDDGDSGGWRFPPNGWIKCNVDGSAPEDKASGCGGVFRDSTGSWLYGFAVSLDRGTSSAIELSAISIALDIAWDRGFRKLILETDSLTVADVVNNKDGACSHRLHEKKLVESIRDKKKKRKWDVRIVHSRREGNKVADWLANLSHGLQVGDQIELPKLPHGCCSCHELMLEDTRLAKAKSGRSMTDRLRCIGMKSVSFLLVMFLVLSPYVVHVPN